MCSTWNARSRASAPCTQFFPRSEGAYLDDNGKKVQGNFHTAVSGLERAKAEGFNIVYLPPIFPIGVTNRKGPDGALNAARTTQARRSALAANSVDTTPSTTARHDG